MLFAEIKLLALSLLSHTTRETGQDTGENEDMSTTSIVRSRRWPLSPPTTIIMLLFSILFQSIPAGDAQHNQLLRTIHFAESTILYSPMTNVTTTKLPLSNNNNKNKDIVHVHDLNGTQLPLELSTFYAVRNKATGFTFGTTEPLDLWNTDSWRMFHIWDNLGNFTYVLGPAVPTGSRKGFELVGTIFEVQISKAPPPADDKYYFIHSANCQDGRPGLKYFSSRNDFLKGTYCGLYERPEGVEYEWANFEFEFIPFADYFAERYKIHGGLSNFRFHTTPAQILKHREEMPLIKSQTVRNCLGRVLTQTVRHTGRRTEGISSSKVLTNTHVKFNFDSFTFNISGSLLDDGDGAGGGGVETFRTNPELNFPSIIWSPANKEETSAELDSIFAQRHVTYQINVRVELLRYSCVKVSGFVDWIEHLPLEYNASLSIKITGRENGGAMLESKEKLEYVLEKLGFLENPMNYIPEEVAMEYLTYGRLAASFGTKSIFTAVSALPESECHCSHTRTTSG